MANYIDRFEARRERVAVGVPERIYIIDNAHKGVRILQVCESELGGTAESIANRVLKLLNKNYQLSAPFVGKQADDSRWCIVMLKMDDLSINPIGIYARHTWNKWRTVTMWGTRYKIFDTQSAAGEFAVALDKSTQAKAARVIFMPMQISALAAHREG